MMYTLLIAGCLLSQHVDRTHDVTDEDYFTLSWISDCEVSPDGNNVAWVEGRWDENLDRRNMDLWVANRRGTEKRRLTFDTAGDFDPQWGADGQWIYFASSRGERANNPPLNRRKQIWRIRPDGTGLMAVTRLKNGLSEWALARGGDLLFYTSHDDEQAGDRWGPLRKKYNDVEYGHGAEQWSALYRLDLNTWRTEEIYDEQRFIVEFAPSPNGDRVAMITTPDQRLITNEGQSEIDVLDTATGNVRRLDDTLWRAEAPSPFGWLGGPAWSSDGKRLAFNVDFDGFPAEIIVASLDNDEPLLRRIDRLEEATVASRPYWIPRTHNLSYIAERGTLRPVALITNADTDRASGRWIQSPEICVWSMDVADKKGDIAVVASTATTPPVVGLLGGPQQFSAVVDPNEHAHNWRIPEVRTVSWTAEDGTRIEGVLESPWGHSFERDGPLPMFVHLHGGPTSASSACLEFSSGGRGLWATRGWALFSPNYRGSTGYGDEFVTDLVGHENEIEVTDILAGVDAMVAQGIADPDRLAVGGWSNGGYLTNCIIAATDRFKAASSGAGVFDQTMQWSIEDTPGHVINYAGGSLPWEDPEELRRMSPLYGAESISTPTLIHVGEGDARVPPQQARALFRALHDYLGVDSQLVVYDGEGHGISKMSNRKARIAWDKAWIEHWVQGKEPLAGVVNE